ncbi:WD-40 repeat protein [Reticulomyxa filosa]|uniref:WD-40 repeat protein n=1 Tax=Reticulomyxa filosa TaxID=46433 RepID=X6P1L3_RETFI|nr:WD-40 repeat protein [Reticulomyxa filosa]|eukprot:ETO32141.1 WD-40 repeat protein [Reticulomyxa filosa]
MTTLSNEKQTSTRPTFVSFHKTEEEEIQTIIQYWIRILNIKLGWIHDFDKFVVNYVTFFFIYLLTYVQIFLFNLTQATIFIMLDTFRLSSKLIKTFNGHTDSVYSIDYLTFNNCQFICSGSNDKTVRIWDINTNQQIRLFDEHSSDVYCVKFSSYHYHIIIIIIIVMLFALHQMTEQFVFGILKIINNYKFKGHTDGICGIKFSSFNNGRYLCSGSYDNTIRLWDVETFKSLYIFEKHTNPVWCVDISPLQSNSNNNVGLIGGNGYTICSGSWDKTICIWDIETTKHFITFKGHTDWIRSVKYGLNKSIIIDYTNIILSGSEDHTVRLWDIRSGEQIQVFNGHTNAVNAVEYSSFIVNDNKIGCNSNVICSASWDSTIRFWDIRSNKKELYMIEGDCKDNGIFCFNFLQKMNNNSDCGINLCYGSSEVISLLSNKFFNTNEEFMFVYTLN